MESHTQATLPTLEEHRGELPLLKTLCGCLARAEDEGMGNDDFSALIRLLAAK